MFGRFLCTSKSPAWVLFPLFLSVCFNLYGECSSSSPENHLSDAQITRAAQNFIDAVQHTNGKTINSLRIALEGVMTDTPTINIPSFGIRSGNIRNLKEFYKPLGLSQEVFLQESEIYTNAYTNSAMVKMHIVRRMVKNKKCPVAIFSMVRLTVDQKTRKISKLEEAVDLSRPAYYAIAKCKVMPKSHQPKDLIEKQEQLLGWTHRLADTTATLPESPDQMHRLYHNLFSYTTPYSTIDNYDLLKNMFATSADEGNEVMKVRDALVYDRENNVVFAQLNSFFNPACTKKWFLIEMATVVRFGDDGKVREQTFYVKDMEQGKEAYTYCTSEEGDLVAGGVLIGDEL